MANKARYQTEGRGPFLALLTELDGEGRAWRVYLPHRDTRFSKDKAPDKDFIGAVAQRPSGAGYFVRVDARGLISGTGYPFLAPDQLVRHRRAIADDESGADIVGVLDAIRCLDRRVGPGYPAPLKTVPRGFPKDHRRGDLLRWKGLECSARFGAAPWLGTADASGHVIAVWADAEPMNAWLDRHVGPSALSPEELCGR